jgi:hypothetical protein
MSEELIVLLEEKPLKVRLQVILKGLKAPKASGEFRHAKFELLRLLGPSTISLLAGVGVAVGLLVFAVGQQLSGESAVEVTVVEMETVKLDDLKIEEIKPEEVETREVAVDTTMVAPPSEYSAPSETVGAGVNGDVDTPMVMFAPVMTKSPLVMKNLYGNRSKGGRDKALQSYGGSTATEDAVMKALRWLKAHQHADGYWNGVRAPYTGLALLAFLAHGETPVSPEFGPTVEKAIRWLMTQQNSAGSFSSDSYGHAICTYALAESFAMTKIMSIREATEKGLRVIMDGQQDDGGWFYRYEKDKKWDLSVMGWQIQALKAAKMGGLDTPEIERSLEQATRAVQMSYHSARETFCYQGAPGVADSGGAMWSMNGIGTLCLQYLGKAKTKEARGGLKAIEDLELVWGTVDASGKAVPEANNKVGKNEKVVGEGWAQLVRVYAYYYITQAKFQNGGPQWKKWNEQFTRVLIRNQQPEGCWEGGDFGSSYGGAQGEADKVYTTCFCCLMLEVYYRYLPTYQKIDDGKDTHLTTDDPVVEVL